MKINLLKIIRNAAMLALSFWLIAQAWRFINFLHYSRFLHDKIEYEINWHIKDILEIFVFLLFVEFNYRVIFKRYKWYLFLLANFVTSTLCFTVLIIILNNQHLGGLLFDIRPVAMMIAYGFIYAWLREYFHQRILNKEIKLQQSKNELDALKAQLNPHFLFNSLNYLYGTALNENAQNTADGIDTLSAMMRYTISGVHEDFVPVENELSFIKNYLDIQQQRLPKKDNIDIKVKVDAASSSLQIAPLLMLPFIENSFQYGISMDEPCFVHIEIKLTNMLSLAVSNSISRNINRVNGNNTGIQNTVKRLELLYPGKYMLEQSHTETEYHTKLFLKLNA